MTLLHTPMPAERALNTMDTMQKSNGSITTICKYFSLEDGKEWTCFGSWHISVVWNDIDKEKPITIISITQTIPTYSVWDKVLILSTGEIGEVASAQESTNKYLILSQTGSTMPLLHWSEIAKLPNDL